MAHTHNFFTACHLIAVIVYKYDNNTNKQQYIGPNGCLLQFYNKKLIDVKNSGQSYSLHSAEDQAGCLQLSFPPLSIYHVEWGGDGY